MPGPDDGLGKKAEEKLKLWLDDPDGGYSFDRIPDQMSGYYAVSRNICDFICFKSPNQYYIESKSTWNDRFEFQNISSTQSCGLNKKSKISNCFGLITVLFATYKRCFVFDIRDIRWLIENGIKSINIKKINKWKIPYQEIQTIKSKKELLDYTGSFESLVADLQISRSFHEYEIK